MNDSDIFKVGSWISYNYINYIKKYGKNWNIVNKDLKKVMELKFWSKSVNYYICDRVKFAFPAQRFFALDATTFSHPLLCWGAWGT